MKSALGTYLISAALLLGGGQAAAQTVRFFVNDTTTVIEQATSFASVPTPAGYTSVAKSVIDAACSCASRMRGMWDGTTYTLPPSEQALATDAGQLKVAARVLHQRLIGLTERPGGRRVLLADS